MVPTSTEAADWTPKARAVFDAATRLFYDHGIHAVGVDRIAAEAGVTKKTLYDRFGSKERLVVEYLRQRDLRWREFLAERLSAARAVTPAERLRTIFDASAAWMGVHGTKGCSMVNAHAEISDPAHPAYAVIVGQKQWQLEQFRDIAVDAGVVDPNATAGALMLLHEGALVMHGMHTFEEPLARARDLALAELEADGSGKG
jgi:AcrR family transcriptional regulator